ncbi:hypothetical protein KKI24_14340 [bacterium]|nr:hypothetical protein [bacterium]
MTVVRELVNRISFKVNPGDKANAEKAFSNMKNQAGGTLGFIKGLGPAINTALTAITGLVAAGSLFKTNSEKDTATVRFYSRMTEEANKLLKVMDKLKGGNREIVSKREVEAAGAMFSQLSLGGKNAQMFEKFAPLMKLIAKANPKMDFTEVAKAIKSWAETGDLEALKQLGAVGVEIAEAIRLSGLDINNAIKGQENKLNYIFGKLKEKENKLAELVKLQESTQIFAWQGMAKEGSDFLYNFGENTSPAITKAVSAIRDMLKELNESDGFWEGVRTAVNGIQAMIESTLEMIERIRTMMNPETPPEGELPHSSMSDAARGQIGYYRSMYDPNYKQPAEESKPGPYGRYDYGASANQDKYKNQDFSGIAGLISSVKEKVQQGVDRQTWLKSEQTVTVKGEITIKGENTGNLDLSTITKQVSEAVVGNIKTSLKNIAAANSVPVSP